jgi:hypothetical protein
MRMRNSLTRQAKVCCLTRLSKRSKLSEVTRVPQHSATRFCSLQTRRVGSSKRRGRTGSCGTCGPTRQAVSLVFASHLLMVTSTLSDSRQVLLSGHSISRWGAGWCTRGALDCLLLCSLMLTLALQNLVKTCQEALTTAAPVAANEDDTKETDKPAPVSSVSSAKLSRARTLLDALQQPATSI